MKERDCRGILIISFVMCLSRTTFLRHKVENEYYPRLAVYEGLPVINPASPSLLPIAKVHKNSKKMQRGLNF